MIHEAHIRGTERLTVRQIVEQSSNIGTITIAERLGAGPARVVGRPLRIREEHRHRLPGRVGGLRPAARPVVGLDDRHRPDRPRHRGHAGPDGARVLGDRERRRARAPASHRPHRRADASRRRAGAASSRAPSPSRCSRCCAASSSRERAPRPRSPGYTVAGKTGTAAKIDPDGTLLDVALRRVVRRARAGDEAEARDHGHGRRAARRHLRRRRRRAGVPRDRALQPPAPRDSAGRAERLRAAERSGSARASKRPCAALCSSTLRGRWSSTP